jgi:ligand-binding sensor domain-containing protein
MISTDDGSISHSSINVIYEDNDEQLWFGTRIGLDRFDFETGKFIQYWTDENNRNKDTYYGSNHWIYAIFQDDAGIIWLGTDRGLVEYNTKENSFSTHLFIPQDPLNQITSISQDVLTGCLWLATTDGLFSFDIKSKNLRGITLKQNVCLANNQELYG